MADTSRLTNEVITHTHHHPGPGSNAHKEAECRAAVSNRFRFKWRCLTAGGVQVAKLSGATSVASDGRPSGRERTTTTGYVLILWPPPETSDFATLISCTLSPTTHRMYRKYIPAAIDPETSTIIRMPKNSCGEPEYSGCDVW